MSIALPLLAGYVVSGHRFTLLVPMREGGKERSYATFPLLSLLCSASRRTALLLLLRAATLLCFLRSSSRRTLTGICPTTMAPGGYMGVNFQALSGYSRADLGNIFFISPFIFGFRGMTQPPPECLETSWLTSWRTSCLRESASFKAVLGARGCYGGHVGQAAARPTERQYVAVPEKRDKENTFKFAIIMKGK